MNTILKISMISLILVLSGSICVWAETVEGLKEFKSGDPALASEVNNNFNAVKTAVDNNDNVSTENSSFIATNIGNIATNTDNIASNAAAITGITGSSNVVAGAMITTSLRIDTISTTINNSYSVSSCTWNTKYKRFEITITGEKYFWTDYVTIVTSTGEAPYIARTGSVSDKLLIYLSDLNGDLQAGSFQFVTYKFQ